MSARANYSGIPLTTSRGWKLTKSPTAVATLRIEPHPTLVKIRSVKVETSLMFAHLNEDGSVVIHDDEEDED